MIPIKRAFLVLSLLISVTNGYSQFNKQDISFELRYPIPFGNNFINKGIDKGYIGLFDLGIDYSVFKVNKVGIGVNFNSSALRYPESKVTLMIFSPKIKIDYDLTLDKISIIPSIAMGYSNWRFWSGTITLIDDNQVPYSYKFKQNSDGITFKGAVKIKFNSTNRITWYTQLAYEFTQLEKNEIGNTAYNRNIQILYPGLGITWRFND